MPLQALVSNKLRPKRQQLERLATTLTKTTLERKQAKTLKMETERILPPRLKSRRKSE